MIDLSKYLYGPDVWEGSLDIDENVIFAGGSKFIIIRMNDTVGGLHLDENFKKQWDQSRLFGKCPYFVVAPWIYASAQAKFIMDNMPQGCKTICLDVELHYNETPTQYAVLLKQLITQLKTNGYLVIIYTGQWFMQYVSPWPTDCEYWLAAYALIAYPKERISLTWDQSKEIMKQLNWPTLVMPGKIVIYQFTGDRWILPGCANRAVDMNLMLVSDFERVFGQKSSPVTGPINPTFNQYQAQCTASGGLYIRLKLDSTSSAVGGLKYQEIVTVLEESNGWARIDRGWVSLTYLKKIYTSYFPIAFK
jgi:hypothetical protein